MNEDSSRHTDEAVWPQIYCILAEIGKNVHRLEKKKSTNIISSSIIKTRQTARLFATLSHLNAELCFFLTDEHLFASLI